jgi:hypothetical protein
VGLDSGTVSSITRLRIYGIAGLDNSGNDGQHIIGTPQVAFRSLIRVLSCLESILLTIEFVEIFGASTYQSRLLDFPDTPVVKTAIFVNSLNYRFLGAEMGASTQRPKQREAK